MFLSPVATAQRAHDALAGTKRVAGLETITGRTAAQRLQELKECREMEFITHTEYKEKRQRIIANI